jgi:hypothetical protein
VSAVHSAEPPAAAAVNVNPHTAERVELSPFTFGDQLPRGRLRELVDTPRGIDWHAILFRNGNIPCRVFNTAIDVSIVNGTEFFVVFTERNAWARDCALAGEVDLADLHGLACDQQEARARHQQAHQRRASVFGRKSARSEHSHK